MGIFKKTQKRSHSKKTKVIKKKEPLNKESKERL